MVMAPDVPLAAPPFTVARLKTRTWRALTTKETLVTGVMPPAYVDGHRWALPEMRRCPGFWMIRTVTCPPELLYRGTAMVVSQARIRYWSSVVQRVPQVALATRTNWVGMAVDVSFANRRPRAKLPWLP